MKSIVFMVLSVLLWLSAWQNTFAQERPKWSYGYFEEFQNSYLEVVVGTGYDIDDAKLKAKKQILERRSLATGTDAVVSIESDKVQITSEKKLVVNARIVDEYYEHNAPGEYKAYLLVQTAKNPTYEFEPVKVSDKYPFSARVFIPGMAQIYKGSITKGACFITGEMIFVGGIVTAECMRNVYVNKINSTRDVTLRKTYTQYANNAAIIRNVSIAGAVAIYVWNIIDGVVAKGKKHVFVGNLQMDITPYVDMYSGGLAVNINF